MRVLDSASHFFSRLQELAVLGANDTNTEADSVAIDAEAEAIADEFHRLMSTSTTRARTFLRIQPQVNMSPWVGVTRK